MKKSSKPNDPQRKEDLVMTPGGPRSKDKVHTVRPDEAVRMDESGKVVIEPWTIWGHILFSQWTIAKK